MEQDTHPFVASLVPQLRFLTHIVCCCFRLLNCSASISALGHPLMAPQDAKVSLIGGTGPEPPYITKSLRSCVSQQLCRFVNLGLQLWNGSAVVCLDGSPPTGAMVFCLFEIAPCDWEPREEPLQNALGSRSCLAGRPCCSLLALLSWPWHREVGPSVSPDSHSLRSHWLTAFCSQ